MSADLGQNMTFDSDGDINVLDPVSGLKSIYISNQDGTYTNPVTDATYTKEELKSTIESRIENKDLLRQD